MFSQLRHCMLENRIQELVRVQSWLQQSLHLRHEECMCTLHYQYNHKKVNPIRYIICNGVFQSTNKYAIPIVFPIKCPISMLFWI